MKKEGFFVPDFNYYGNNTLYIEKDVTVLATKDESKEITVKYEMQEQKKYKSGDQVGVAHLLLKDKELTTIRIYVSKQAEEKKQGIFAKIFGWLFGW